MRLIFARCDPQTLMPLSPAHIARREQIRAEQARVAKASEAYLPHDEQRQVIDLRELAAAAKECAVACACAAPVSVAIVLYQMLSI